MTDHAELRRLAKAATPGPWRVQTGCSWRRIGTDSGDGDVLRPCTHPHDGWPDIVAPAENLEYIASANPKTILALLDEIDGLRSRLEIDERTPHDGIACRDETIKVLDEKCDRLKVENERLLDELSACTEHPGGCGYWREAAKRRAEERDRLRAQNDALRGALQAVVDDPTWRSNDNTLWPKIIKAMNPQGATSSP
ncbi:ead/Ea22-like family protein [Pseudomonas aeruginosa]|uniref:ead/Ea22-like family protein n=1 Tax=Pseudomonas aeruginosa TaxID=287 RepID=UPI001C8BC70D|nr:ead/Ea22-like family protein [Pseudomonas aeruginosa]MDG3611184.1 ead/Ea22-like family protein [Pseudomonas aeruginosa]MDG3629722.1 ead/Ea22-like family protein [Pseudomonas aeruginosa]MDG3642980.1 ead/Ea22-like family protein [Pseudomonas aeruginosa]MDG3663112.1 ead/Ea22-like family protein [Pseudomonas aeruginosa]MDG3708050.1 ead/Ea22-like family protein [Pseudomonas aeruginosa]